MTTIRLLNPFSRPAEHEVIEHVEIRDLNPKPVLAVIGHTAMSLTALRNNLVQREAVLTVDIDRLTEDRRQTRQSLAGISVALGELKDDPGLTEEQRQAVRAAVDDDYIRKIDDLVIPALTGEAAE